MQPAVKSPQGTFLNYYPVYSKMCAYGLISVHLK